MSSLALAIMFLPGLAVGLTFHEFAHAWSASLLGDEYARRQGRVSLNPFRHLSLLGTLAIFVVHFGWGKPVPVNLYNFKRPRRDFLLTSLAGPAANLVVASLCILAMHFTRHSYYFGLGAAPLMELGHIFLMLTVLINTILAAINLLPVPPLDGSKIWPCLFPALKPSFGPKMTWFFVAALILTVQMDWLSPAIGAMQESVASITPVSDQTHFNDKFTQGWQAHEDGDSELAEKLLTEALAINPDSAEALHWRTVVYMDMDRYEEALADINRAIEIDKWDADYYDTRATLLDRLDRAEDAEEDRQTAAAIRKLYGSDSVPEDEPAESTSKLAEPTTQAEDDYVDF